MPEREGCVSWMFGMSTGHGTSKGRSTIISELPDIAGTVIDPGSTYRIDGKGDDQYNAQIDLHLKVPLMYDDAS